jgi:Cu/Ag efflux protein CusF
MGTAKTGITAGAVAVLMISAAYAQNDMTGTVTKINRLNSTVTILQTQSGTVGSSGSAARDFKVKDGATLEDVHAGDKVNFSTTDENGVETVTKLKKP